MWILSCENIWGKYEIWELAGFFTLFVYQSKHTIAPGYAMHCPVLPVGPFTEKAFRKEVIKQNLKILQFTHKIILFLWKLKLPHGFGEEQLLSPGLGDHRRILTAALEKIGRCLGNNLTPQVWCLARARRLWRGRPREKPGFGQGTCRTDWDLSGWVQTCRSKAECQFRCQVDRKSVV